MFLITEDLGAPNKWNHIWGGMQELFNPKRNKLPVSLQAEVRGMVPMSPAQCPITNLRFLQDPCWRTCKTSPQTLNPEDSSLNTAFAWLMQMDEISAAGNKTIYAPWHVYAKPSQLYFCSVPQAWDDGQQGIPIPGVRHSSLLLAFTAVLPTPNSWVPPG